MMGTLIVKGLMLFAGLYAVRLLLHGKSILSKRCIKSVRIRSYSGLHFPALGVSLCIHSECGKMRTRITPNTDTFYAVKYVTIRDTWNLCI